MKYSLSSFTGASVVLLLLQMAEAADKTVTSQSSTNSSAVASTSTDSSPGKSPNRFAEEVGRARKIAVNDILSIRVVGEPDLSREVKVDGDGRIDMLYIGSVVVAGKSPADVAAEIRDGLDRDWIINPQVAVDIKLYDVHYVTVMGAVNHAQQVQILPDHRMDVLEAIGGAGDFTRDADRQGITLRRASTGQVLPLKYRELIRATEPSQRIFVEPGDVINVERTIF